MAHPDDVSALDRALDQMEQVYHECFRMATRLVTHDGGLDSFESREAREKCEALIPIVALDIKQHLQNLLNLDEVPERHLLKAQESADQIIAKMKKRNDAAENR